MTGIKTETDLPWQRVHPLSVIVDAIRSAVTMFWVVVCLLIVEIMEGKEHGGFTLLDNGWIVYVLIAFLGFIILVMILRWWFLGYAVTEQGVYLRQGVIFKKQRRVLIERIQALNLNTPFFARILGLTRLRVESAGGADSHIDIQYLRRSQAQALRHRISDLMNAQRAQSHRDQLSAPIPAADNSASTQSGTQSRPARQLDPVAAHLQTREAYDTGDYPLFTIQPARLIISAALRPIVFAGLLAVIALLCVLAFARSRALLLALSAGNLILLITLIASAFAVIWKELAGQWGFTAAVTQHGIRIHRGLLATNSQTLPPGRIHAITLEQPFLWRLPNWWRAKFTVAGWQNETSENSEAELTTVLPVGTRKEAELALWLAVRDLGVNDPLDLLAAGFNEEQADARFHPIGRGGHLLDPLARSRRAVALTPTVTVIRDGWLRKSLSVIPHEHAQSVSLHQGVVQAWREVATVSVDTVSGVVPTKIKHQDAARGRELTRAIAEFSRQRRQVEALVDWNQRIRRTAQRLTGGQQTSGENGH